MGKQWEDQQSDEVKTLSDILKWLRKLQTNLLAGSSVATGWTDDGTTIRLTTSTDKVHIGDSAAATHTLTVTDSGADSLKVTGVVSSGKTTWIGASDDLFDMGVAVKGAGMAYKIPATEEQYFVKVADDTAVEGALNASIGYINLNTEAEAFYEAHSDSIIGKVLTTSIGSAFYVGFGVSDPGGFFVQGKDSGSTNFAFRVIDGNATFGIANELFGVRNDGIIGVDGNIGTTALVFERPSATSLSIGVGTWTAKAAGLLNSVIIGGGAMTPSLTLQGSDNTIVGFASGSGLVEGDRNVFLGSETGASTDVNGSIALGAGATVTGDGQLVVGSEGIEITDVYFGAGVALANPVPANVTIHASGGSGTDINGANITIAGGKPTGAGLGGHVIIQTAAAGATGTTLRSLATIAEFTDDSKIGFFGVTPVVRQTELTDELTTITHSAPGTPDYAIQDLVAAVGYGFVTSDEAQTVLSVIANLQARVNELETKLTAYGLLVDAD